ncbi:uncharacterized protein LOC142603124 [Balearica regulorum gibbericeps]|uniref:uncharacterized protein LOC142603124 n=1 Tax=Balearica regulorum gibbericeps TaxID=100784 RepID=UPI003F5F6524
MVAELWLAGTVRLLFAMVSVEELVCRQLPGCFSAGSSLRVPDPGRCKSVALISWCAIKRALSMMQVNLCSSELACCCVTQRRMWESRLFLPPSEFGCSHFQGPWPAHLSILLMYNRAGCKQNLVGPLQGSGGVSPSCRLCGMFQQQLGELLSLSSTAQLCCWDPDKAIQRERRWYLSRLLLQGSVTRTDPAAYLMWEKENFFIQQ